MANDQKKPSPLTAIEQEGDAARVAAARQLAQKAINNPSLISTAELNRLGNRGVHVFVDELKNTLIHSVTGSRVKKPNNVSATKSNAGKEAPNSGSTNAKQPAKVGKGNAGAKPAAESSKPTSRPPHNLHGWAHLRVRRKTWPGGFALGLIIGAMLLLLGVLALGAPMLQFAIRSH